MSQRLLTTQSQLERWNNRRGARREHEQKHPHRHRPVRMVGEGKQLCMSLCQAGRRAPIRGGLQQIAFPGNSLQTAKRVGGASLPSTLFLTPFTSTLPQSLFGPAQNSTSGIKNKRHLCVCVDGIIILHESARKYSNAINTHTHVRPRDIIHTRTHPHKRVHTRTHTQRTQTS